MYDRMMTEPMRQELVAVGVEDLTTAEDVDAFVARKGTTVVVVNSVCGCAAGNARPGIGIFLQGETKADHVGSVFAGVDQEATARARELFGHIPPSSPSIAVLKDGEVVHMLHRHSIENRAPEEIATELADAVKDCATA